MRLIIDTREQNPLQFSRCRSITEYLVKKLDVGDYSMEGYEDKIAIEKKTVLDLFSTLGKGHSRFKKELERAQELDYFALVIEESYNNIRTKTFPNSFRTKMMGYVVTKLLHTMMIKYNVHVMFAKDKWEAARMVEQTLLAYERLNNGKDKTR